MSNKDAVSVRTETVCKVYETDGLAVEAVRDVTLEIEAGEFVVLAGPSGSGKTTLLNLVGGLTHPTSGRVWIADREVTHMSERELARLRLERIGFVFQAFNLLPVLTAGENAEFTLLLQGVPESERRRLVSDVFKRIGIGGLEDRRPSKLSGGQHYGKRIRTFDPTINSIRSDFRQGLAETGHTDVNGGDAKTLSQRETALPKSVHSVPPNRQGMKSALW